MRLAPREAPRTRPSAPGAAGGSRRTRELEFVSSVTEPFCAMCDRLRLTADGRCAHACSPRRKRPARTTAGGATDDELIALILANVAAKGPGHGIGTQAGVMTAPHEHDRRVTAPGRAAAVLSGRIVGERTEDRV